MSNWKTVQLGDILNFKRGHDLPKYDMKYGDIPVAGSNGIIGYHNIATNISPCITIGRSGNVGIPIVIAPNDIYMQYDKVTTSLFDTISKNNIENKILTQLRDTLLPKLMNNEIKI